MIPTTFAAHAVAGHGHMLSGGKGKPAILVCPGGEVVLVAAARATKSSGPSALPPRAHS